MHRIWPFSVLRWVPSRRQLVAWLLSVALLTALIVMAVVLAFRSWVGAGQPSTYRILMVGDSITHGAAGDVTWRSRLWDYVGAVREDICFVGPRFDLHVSGSQEMTNNDYGNPAFPMRWHGAQWGSTYRDHLAGIDSMMRTSRANVVIVQLGTNDLSQQKSPEEVLADARSLVTKIHDTNDSAWVILGGVPKATQGLGGWPLFPDQRLEFNTRLEELATQLTTTRVPVIYTDTDPKFDPASHTTDGIHPNPIGEHLIAASMASALAAAGIHRDPQYGIDPQARERNCAG